MKVTQFPKIIGTDGVNKMSKSLNNEIELSATAELTQKRVVSMVTDPNRQRRTDPGNPDVCNVFSLHKIFSSADQVANINTECRKAGIGCVDCKKMLAENINNNLAGLREKRNNLAAHPNDVWDILHDGDKRASVIADATMEEVRKAIGFAE
jgi:tryptophanyl-tRNA synthetase